MANNAVRDDGEAPAFVFDSLAKFYISLFAVWTSVLLVGVLYLFVNRNAQCIRIRCLPLSVSAVFCLHLFWSGGMFAYSIKDKFPCNAEYWIMNTVLPLGIALFQANNMLLLCVSSRQGDLLRCCRSSESDSLVKSSERLSRFQRCVLWWKNLTMICRTKAGIVMGMVIQVILSLSLFLASRKFHSSFGSMGQHVSQMECRRGVEWIVSIFWQIFWAWLFAPYVLWKIRKIKDVHHWRLQTTICVVAALPGSPLWLTALYSSNKAWETINSYFLPGNWFAPGIMAMQACTIFFPCYDLATSDPTRIHMAGVLRAWLGRSRAVEVRSVAASTRTSESNNSADGMFSKRAFNKCLAEDSRQLFHFAAAKEFSGENIMFLDAVRDWKASWKSLSERLGTSYNWDVDPNGYRLHFFQRAVGIYKTCVDLDSAQFPINIESQIYVELQDLFSDAVRRMRTDYYRQRLSSAALDDDENALCHYDQKSNSYIMERLSSRESITLPTRNDDDYDTEDSVRRAAPSPNPRDCISHKASMIRVESTGSANANGRTDISHPTVGIAVLPPCGITSDCIPRNFSIQAFDGAEKSIRSLVFACTWPKYVRSLTPPGTP